MMENNTTPLNELIFTFSELEKAINRFDESDFNVKPSLSSWSPAMVTQHLVLAGTGIDHLLLGKTKTTAAPADEKVEVLREIFLNFDQKFQAPPFIEPADQNYSKSLQSEKLKAIGNTVAALIPDLDLSLTCLDFEFPEMGYLTRLELISFLVFHTQRHTHQLNQMANNLQ